MNDPKCTLVFSTVPHSAGEFIAGSSRLSILRRRVKKAFPPVAAVIIASPSSFLPNSHSPSLRILLHLLSTLPVSLSLSFSFSRSNAVCPETKLSSCPFSALPVDNSLAAVSPLLSSLMALIGVVEISDIFRPRRARPRPFAHMWPEQKSEI